MEEIKRMPFGKTQRVGNFSVLKYNKTLSRAQIAQLRSERGVNPRALKGIERTGMPYIKVSAISGIWALEFAAPSAMHQFLDTRDYEDEKGLIGLHNLFTEWMSDTLIMGDEEYIRGKGKLMTDFIGRQKSPEDSKAEAEATAEMKDMHSALETANDIAEGLKE